MKNLPKHLSYPANRQTRTVKTVPSPTCSRANKATTDYTSPTLCTSVTPFPPIGDAAYRQRAGGGPSHIHRQHAQKLVKIGVWFRIYTCGQTDTHTDRHTRHNTAQ